MIKRIIRLSHQKGKVNDEVIMQEGMELAHRIFEMTLTDAQHVNLIWFLKHFINFSDKEYLAIFEQELDILTQKSKNMNFMEYVQHKAQFDEKKRTILKLYHNLGLNINQIAKIEEVSAKFVKDTLKAASAQ